MLIKNQSDSRAVLLPRILLFPASLRRDSHQRRLAEYLARRLGDCCEIDMLQAGQANLPIFNQDIEGELAVMEDVKTLHRRFGRADGVIVVSPEYNGHVSPYLKNTFDWISRLARIDSNYADINPFRDKPLLLASASTGWTGGLLGLRDARSLFGHLGFLVVSDQVCVSDADQWVQEGAFEFKDSFGSQIAWIVAEFISLVLRLRTTDTIADVQQSFGRGPQHD